MPGRLSVSRTFGDAQAKLEKFQGNPNVVICDPEIFHIKIDQNNHDYILLGCDGIFDRLSTDFSCQEIWNAQMYSHLSYGTHNRPQNKQFTDAMFHQACGFGVDSLIIKSMKAQSLDNLSLVMIGFKSFQ